MTTLDGLLGKTLLRSGVGSKATSANPTGQYWSFKSNDSAPTLVSGLRCTQPNHGGGTRERPGTVYCGMPGPKGALVCEDIKWFDPTVQFRLPSGTVQTHELPLTAKFQLLSEHISGGVIAEDHNPHWPLAADLDVGVHHIFGFEWDEKRNRFTPLDRAKTSSESFWTEIPEMVSNAASGKTGQTNVYKVVPLRFLVCVSLVCCKPRADFTPGSGALNPVMAARFYPNLALMTNKGSALQHYDARIELMRPAIANRMVHDGEAMSANVAASCYADTNYDRDTGMPSALPLWQYIFDYFKEVAAVGEEFVAVYPSDSAYKVALGIDESGVAKTSDEKRTYRDCVQQLEASGIDTGPHYVARGIRKLAGQGEFDNLHLAPTMTSTDGLRNYPGWHFEKIIMAPFCVHDCMHTHWRWGKGLPMRQKWNNGWSTSGAYAAEGAPMVPLHQQVWVTPLARGGATAHGMRYRVRGNKLGSSEWDVVMPHGSAYSYDVTPLSSLITAAPAALTRVDLQPTWANLYWWLRYSVLLDSTWSNHQAPHDRLRFVDSAKEMKVRRG